MSNSSLATYKLLSPNHSGQRTMPIDRITPHCVVGQLSASGICGCFTSSSVQASCNYGIGKDGDIGLCVEEKNRSWCTSSNANDQRAVTIECASDMTDPYAFTDKCYNSLINLCVDICKRNGKKKLIWFGDKTKTLNYSPKSDEMILTVHRWFANKACPGNWMYSRMGDLANKVTARLNGNEIDTSTSTSTSEPMTYFVRKTFSDSSSQLGAYSVLENAKKMVDQNPTYKVFDAKGKVIYEKSNTSSTVSNNLDHKPVLKGTTDKIWMGWLKRESGTKGYRCVLGDSGAANSAYQFDYRYALVPFMQYCVDKFPSHYDGFKKYIVYGAGSSKLRGNTELANLWLSYCDKYWDEFCSLQDSYAYTKYYLEAKQYIKNLYGIEMDDHSPAVKGTLFSMAIRSGSLTGARKFAGCNNKTSDEEMLRISYSTYGNQDANRWTKSGQYGDALNALKNGEYTSITVEGSTPSQLSTPSTSKTPYRVATSYSGGKYVGQIGAYEILANATKAASEASQSSKKTYYVYDNTGAVVYTAEYKSSSTSKKLYDVRVTTTDLRIRETPNGTIKGYIKPGIYGITEEKTVNGLKWGHLLSGAGWIALKYATKL